jgi:tRNA(Ile)-lysidine synthase
LNHGLRGVESDGDECFVVDLAAKLGVPAFTRRIEIGRADGNIEAVGRAARKAFFEELMAEHGFTRLALAHHRGDRVETFLLHLLRGAGTEGLASMMPATGVTIRPLIESSRPEIEEYLRSRSQSWRVDGSNDDTSFARNRLRHDVIPELARAFNPRIVETLSRTIELLDDEDAWMRQIAEDWFDRNSRIKEDEVRLDARALLAEHPALARRVIRMALRAAGSSLRDATFEHFERVRGLLQDGKSGKVVPLPGGVVASREFDALVFAPERPAALEFDYELMIPGSVRVPELQQSFRAKIVNGANVSLASGNTAFVDGERLGGCVKIRNWKPGDYYRPQGLPAGKLKKLFQRARIPRSQRSCWPVFATSSAIVWVASFPVSRDFAPGGRTQKIVAFEALPD